MTKVEILIQKDINLPIEILQGNTWDHALSHKTLIEKTCHSHNQNRSKICKVSS